MKGRPLVATVLCSLVLTTPGMPAGAAPPTCHGVPATIVGTNGPDILVGTPHRDVIAGLGGQDVIRGRGGNDLICGGPGSDELVGGSGNDHLFGGKGADDLFGGPGNDELHGGRGTDLLIGGPGNDLLDGGTGAHDLVSFLFSTGGVHVDLTSGAATGQGSDTLTGIEDVQGSSFDDTIVGDGNNNDLYGEAGNDTLTAGAGSVQILAGGPGNDSLSAGVGAHNEAWFADSQGPVNVDLATGQATGEGADTLSGIQDVYGSNSDDQIAGDDAPNVLVGARGDDHIFGRGGDDTLFSGFNIYIQAGNDSLDGGAGYDGCFFGTTVNCEASPPPVVFPGPLAIVDAPLMGQTLPAGSMHAVSGSSLYFAGTTPRAELQIALRRLTPGGCQAWLGALHELVARPCSDPLWITVPYDKQGRWSYPISGALLPGTYRILARGKGWGHPFFEPNRNLVDFTLI